jgi:hypothetical protein
MTLDSALPLQRPSVAKANAESQPVIAAVNRCATQKRRQSRVFLHSVPPCPSRTIYETASSS